VSEAHPRHVHTPPLRSVARGVAHLCVEELHGESRSTLPAAGRPVTAALSWREDASWLWHKPTLCTFSQAATATCLERRQRVVYKSSTAGKQSLAKSKYKCMYGFNEILKFQKKGAWTKGHFNAVTFVSSVQIKRCRHYKPVTVWFKPHTHIH